MLALISFIFLSSVLKVLLINNVQGRLSLLEEWTGHNSIQSQTKKLCVDSFVLLVSNLIKAKGVSYQPRHLPSLTRVCVVSKLKAWDLSYPLSVDVQANHQHEHTFDH